MKKTLIFILTLVICLSFFCVSSFAEGIEGTETEEQGAVDRIISSITSSSFWVTIGGVLLALASAVGVFVNKFGTVINLIKNKADTSTVKDTITKSMTEVTETFNKKFNEVSAQLESAKENEKTLTTVLTLFILHSKISTSAKAEILKIIEGYKECNGTVSEIVSAVEEAIAEAEKEEEKVDTPAIDKISTLVLD